MTTLYELGLTTAHLTPSQQDLVAALINNSCAWKVRGGWRPKAVGHRDAKAATADKLTSLRLAEICYGKGSPRLVLTSAGEELAREIKRQRQRRRDRQKRKAA